MFSKKQVIVRQHFNNKDDSSEKVSSLQAGDVKEGGRNAKLQQDAR